MDRAVDGVDGGVDRGLAAQVGLEERVRRAAGLLHVDDGDVLRAEVGEQLQERRADTGVRASQDDTLAFVAEGIGHELVHFFPVRAREHALDGISVHDHVVGIVGHGRSAKYAERRPMRAEIIP